MNIENTKIDDIDAHYAIVDSDWFKAMRQEQTRAKIVEAFYFAGQAAFAWANGFDTVIHNGSVRWTNDTIQDVVREHVEIQVLLAGIVAFRHCFGLSSKYVRHTQGTHPDDDGRATEGYWLMRDAHKLLLIDLRRAREIGKANEGRSLFTWEDRYEHAMQGLTGDLEEKEWLDPVHAIVRATFAARGAPFDVRKLLKDDPDNLLKGLDWWHMADETA